MFVIQELTMFYSPLRYPGGKNRLAKLMAEICVANNIRGHYVEPYAGGASVALHLLIEKKVKSVSVLCCDLAVPAIRRRAMVATVKGYFCFMAVYGFQRL